jgi:hypothetical protein|tara:strand:- start:41 stop:739 length:699 start_codon:yes stop_codon:yes gene_type:complete
MTKTQINLFSKDGLDKIKTVSILDEDNFKIISDLSTELQRVFEIKQIYRTETEIKYSILNDVKFPTPASKYWQAVREQDVFFKNLVFLSCDYDEKQGELELAEIELEEITDDKRKQAREKIKKAQIKRLQFSLMDMKMEAKDRVREIAVWEEQKNVQKKKQNFDINDVNAHQLVSLGIRWSKEFEIGKLTGHESLMKNSFASVDTMKNDEEITESVKEIENMKKINKGLTSI